VECDTPLQIFRWGLQLCFLITIGGLQKKLCALKVVRIPTVGILRLPLGSPEIKSHLDVAPMGNCRVYYMGEGGGFPRVRAVVSLVSPKSHVPRPSTKVAPKSELTIHKMVGCRFDQVIEKLVTLPSLIMEPQHAPFTPFSAKSWECAPSFE
jgi:hypothetical protein